MKKIVAIACLLAGLSTGGASALELTFGLAVAPTTVDPHHQNLVANNEVRRHLFESLTWLDERNRLKPQLALSWEALDDTSWTLALRPDVTFHDGSPFTARDVIYSACRISGIDGDPSPFSVFTRAITAMSAPDPMTVVIETAHPNPQLPVELSTWGILSATANGVAGEVAYAPDGCTGVAAYPQREDFDRGGSSVGTGPFRLVEFVPGNRIVTARNEAYWGRKHQWTKLSFKMLPDDAVRVGALLAGEVDLISEPPNAVLARLRNHGGVELAPGQAMRTVFLQFNHAPKAGPGLSGTGGKNPFSDPNVREAVAAAIDRGALVAATRDGTAVPAGALTPNGYGETYGEDAIHDPARARALLAAAGYEGGFDLVLATPAGQLSHRGNVARAVARMLSDVGIRTTVDIVTADDFYARRNRGEFSLYVDEWARETTDPSAPLRALVATRDAGLGHGGSNWGGYSNAELDGLILAAMGSADVEMRAAKLEEASAVAMSDNALVPLYHEATSWAHRWGLAYELRVPETNMATRVVNCIPCHDLPSPPGLEWAGEGVWRFVAK